MGEEICANVSVFRRGRLQQGYSLNGDRIRVTLRSRGFSVVLEMKDKHDEDRPQASIKVCGHTIFDTEEHGLHEPRIIVIDSLTALGDEARKGTLEDFVPHTVLKEARASVALDGQTQSGQEE